MQLAILIAQILLKFGPAVAQQFQILFSKNEAPTQDEWNKIWEITQKPWQDYKPPGQ